MHRGIRMGLRGGELARTKGSYSDTEHCASESEQSGGETIIYLGNNIRDSITSHRQADVRRAVISRRFNHSNNVSVDSMSGGFQAVGSGFRGYDRCNVSCPERENQRCRHSLQRQPMDFNGGDNRCQHTEMSGGDNQFRLDNRCCQAVYAVLSSCEAETEARLFGRNVEARGNLSTGVTGEPNSQSRCNESRQSSIYFRDESRMCGAKQKRLIPGSSVVYEHPRFGQVWVDGPSCEPLLYSDAVSNCSNTLQGEEEGGMVYHEHGNWKSLFPSSACGRLDHVQSMVGKTAYHASAPQAPLCCRHVTDEHCPQFEGIPGTSSYHIHYRNQRAGGLDTNRSDHSAERTALCLGKHGPFKVRTLPSFSRKPERHHCDIGPSSFTEIGMGGQCHRIHSRCNGSLARPTTTKPAKPATDRTALWVKAMQGYCSHKFVQSYERHDSASNSCSQALIFPHRHLALSESSADSRSIQSPSSGVNLPVACDDSSPLYENISGPDVESEELFEPGLSPKTVDEKLWYTADELTELGFEVFPKRKTEALAVTPVSQHSTYDEDLEKELDLLCDVSSRRTEDKVSTSSQSIQLDSNEVKGVFPDVPHKISTAPDKKLCNGDGNVSSETPSQNSEKESVSQVTSEGNSLSQRSLAQPDGSSNPTIFEKLQSPQSNDILCKTDSFGEEDSSVERCVEGKSPEETFTGGITVECLLPLQTFNRSLSCDVQTGERTPLLEISNVLKAHGDALACSVTDKSPGDSRETSNSRLPGYRRRSERKGRASDEHLSLDPTLKVPASVHHRRSTSSLISALSSALRCSSYLEKSKPGSWRRCHSHETNISCGPYPTKDEEASAPAVNKNKCQKRFVKWNKGKMDGSRKAVGNCCIPVSLAIPTTIDVSSGYESMAQGVEDSTLSRHLTRNVCSDSMSENSYRKESLDRCTDRKGKVCLV